MTRYFPEPLSGNSRPVVAGIVDRANQITGKVTHRWSDTSTSSGLFAWYQSQEPDARFYGGDLFKNGADPGDGALVRSVHLIALNHLWVPGARTVVAARYGFNRFVDDNRPASFDPSSLAFDPAFLRLAPLAKFPQIHVADYGRGASCSATGIGTSLGTIPRRYTQACRTRSDVTTFDLAAMYRLIGARVHNFGGSGDFHSDRAFTSGPDPNAPASASGNALAAFLLGYPTAGSIGAGIPLDFYLQDSAGFMQDDFRVGAKLTVNVGVRSRVRTGAEGAPEPDGSGVGRRITIPHPGERQATGWLSAGADWRARVRGDGWRARSRRACRADTVRAAWWIP